MNHFNYIGNYNINDIFFEKPVSFNRDTDKELLRYCLGATLYMPSNKGIANKVINKQIPGLTSMVMCFEDSIREEDLNTAEQNVISIVKALNEALEKGITTKEDIPLYFLRVRNINQFKSFVERLDGDAFNIITGFIFPKFVANRNGYAVGYEYLETLKKLSLKHGKRIYGMPILESEEIIYSESRSESLRTIRELLHNYRDYILNVRVGGTDFSSRFGLRRGVDYTIYDINTVSSCLTDILNQFTRQEEDYVVSAPVWEYFLSQGRLLKPELRQTPFNINHMLSARSEIIDKAIDGLIREVILDKANGFVGKTIIHPSHISYVNALQCVTKEEYLDAKMILENQGGGVIKGVNGNKMNEINPHFNWAKKTIQKSLAYGVINNAEDYIKLF